MHDGAWLIGRQVGQDLAQCLLFSWCYGNAADVCVVIIMPASSMSNTYEPLPLKLLEGCHIMPHTTQTADVSVPFMAYTVSRFAVLTGK